MFPCQSETLQARYELKHYIFLRHMLAFNDRPKIFEDIIMTREQMLGMVAIVRRLLENLLV